MHRAMNEARRLRSVVLSLQDTELRLHYLKTELARAADRAIATVLDALCVEAEQADPQASELMLTVTLLLTQPDQAELRSRLRECAREEPLLALGRLLRVRTSRQPAPCEPGTDPTRIATGPSGRALTLGERKSLARKPSREALERLFLDPDPQVTRQLLQNPRVTENDVIALAARRPAHQAVLAEVVRHPRWAPRPRVRMALIQNPYAPPELVTPLVALLRRQELEQVLQATDLAAVVRATATEFLARRPPVRMEPSPMLRLDEPSALH